METSSLDIRTYLSQQRRQYVRTSIWYGNWTFACGSSTGWRPKSSMKQYALKGQDLRNLSQLIVENSVTSTASFNHFIQLLQPLHSATSSASFSQRNCLFHPAKSNPSPSEVESSTQRSRIRHPVKSYPSPQWNVWTCAMTYMISSAYIKRRIL